MKTDLVVSAFIIHDNKVLLILHNKLKLWLGPGGHIEKDETPDDAIIREVKEETGLDIRIKNVTSLKGKSVKKNLAIPFYVNVHNVGDHDHCCFFYACSLKNKNGINLEANKILQARWFTKEELNDPRISEDVRNIALMAFTIP